MKSALPLRGRSPGGRAGMEFGTLAGLLATFGLLGTAIALDADWRSFLDPAALLIVVGGTLAVTVTAFGPRQLAHSLRLAARLSALSRLPDPVAHARWLLELARTVRREGLVSLEARIESFAGRPVLARGLLYLLEGRPVAQLRPLLQQERQRLLEPFLSAEAVLRRAAETAPAMGLMGTLIGLVEMLARLDDPQAIGPAMAVALLTTFYGALLGHALLTPLADKLSRHAEAEARLARMDSLAVHSLGLGENPRYLTSALASCLPMPWQLDESD